MLVLSFSQTPKGRKTQLSRGVTFRLHLGRCSVKPPSLGDCSGHHSSRWRGQCKGGIRAPSSTGRKPWTHSVIRIRASLHHSPFHQTKPGIKLEKAQLGRKEAKVTSYTAPLVFLKVLVLENIWQQCDNKYALVKFLSITEWKFWHSKANFGNRE